MYNKTSNQIEEYVHQDVTIPVAGNSEYKLGKQNSEYSDFSKLEIEYFRAKTEDFDKFPYIFHIKFGNKCGILNWPRKKILKSQNTPNGL